MIEAFCDLPCFEPFEFMLSGAGRCTRKFRGKKDGFHSIVLLIGREVLHGLTKRAQETDLPRQFFSDLAHHRLFRRFIRQRAATGQEVVALALDRRDSPLRISDDDIGCGTRLVFKRRVQRTKNWDWGIA